MGEQRNAHMQVLLKRVVQKRMEMPFSHKVDEWDESQRVETPISEEERSRSVSREWKTEEAQQEENPQEERPWKGQTWWESSGSGTDWVEKTTQPPPDDRRDK